MRSARVDDRSSRQSTGSVRLQSMEEEGDNDKKEGGASLLASELLDARTVVISGPVTDKMSASVTARLLVLENRDAEAPITVYVNSPGGSADSGFAIHDILRFISCPVRTIVNGLCASAGILIFLGGDKGSRFSMPGSRFLLHQPSTSGQGSASDLCITAEEIVKIRKRYNQLVCAATGKKPAKVLEDVSRDFWLSPQDALEYGLIDKILEKRSEL